MNAKEVFKSIIALRQSEIPFHMTERDCTLPLNRKKIITIPGVRRCGKSSVMELTVNQLVESGVSPQNILWIGFDDERISSMTTENFDDIVKAYMEMFPQTPLNEVYMFFDEIQLKKDWEYFVLRLYKNYCKNIYICGSNATMLSTELATALRGYPLEYEVFPLSFNEYCRFKNITPNGYTDQHNAMMRNAFNDYNAKGGFPEAVLTESESERIKLLQGYFNTMLLKDLAEHYNISNTNVARYFVKRIMNNVGKQTSINAIFNDLKSQGLKVTKDDLYLWANYVCAIFMFIKVPKYDRSLVKEQQTPAKYYCIDNGLRSAVVLPQSDDNGKNLESVVFLHLYRNRTPGSEIYYYKDKTECDFLVRNYEQVTQLIQVSWDLSDPDTFNREVRALLNAATATNCNNLLIVTADDERELTVKDKTIKVVPAWKFLLTRPNGGTSV